MPLDMDIVFVGSADATESIGDFARRLIKRQEVSRGIVNGRFNSHMLQARPGRTLHEIVLEWELDHRWSKFGPPEFARTVWARGLQVRTPIGPGRVIAAGRASRGITMVTVEADEDGAVALYDSRFLSLFEPKHGMRYPWQTFRLGEIVAYPGRPRTEYVVTMITGPWVPPGPRPRDGLVLQLINAHGELATTPHIIEPDGPDEIVDLIKLGRDDGIPDEGPSLGPVADGDVQF